MHSGVLVRKATVGVGERGDQLNVALGKRDIEDIEVLSLPLN
jgi:hypothetical protein